MGLPVRLVALKIELYLATSDAVDAELVKPNKVVHSRQLLPFISEI